jgi:hypothetical protein
MTAFFYDGIFYDGIFGGKMGTYHSIVLVIFRRSKLYNNLDFNSVVPDLGKAQCLRAEDESVVRCGDA